MDKKDLSIATMTLIRTDREEALLKASLAHLARLDVPVFVTDAGSGESFLQFLRSIPHVTLSGPIRGVWPQTKNSLSLAYQGGSKFIFYTEPDKAGFFARSLPRMLEEIKADEQTGIVLAARSPQGFASFPSFQQMTETTINRCCAEVIGEASDYTYGPFLLNRNLVPYLNGLPDGVGWGWRPYACTVAKRLGFRVEAFAGDFFCPEDQRQDDLSERLYRMRQLSQNMEGLTLAATVPLDAQPPA